MAVLNLHRVGKTQWSKWNDAGREAFNEAVFAGASHAEALSAADAATGKAEAERKAAKLAPAPVEETPAKTPVRRTVAKKGK